MNPPQARVPALSLVIPLFNEEENLSPLIQAIFQALNEEADDLINKLEIVLVNDGSQDRTALLAQQFAARDARIRLINHEQNRGLGAAIRTGLKAATGDLILYTDADLPFDFRVVPDLLKLSGPKTVVIGYRQNRGEGGRRWLLSKGYNLLCRLLFGFRVNDVNFACKLLPGTATRGMNLQAEGSFIDAEMLLECRRLGYTIRQMPLTYYPRTKGESTLSRPAVVWGVIEEMLRYFWRAGFTKYGIVEETHSQR